MKYQTAILDEVNRKILFNEIIPILWNMKDIVVSGRSFEMLHQY